MSQERVVELDRARVSFFMPPLWSSCSFFCASPLLPRFFLFSHSFSHRHDGKKVEKHERRRVYSGKWKTQPQPKPASRPFLLFLSHHSSWFKTSLDSIPKKNPYGREIIYSFLSFIEISFLTSENEVMNRRKQGKWVENQNDLVSI